MKGMILSLFCLTSSKRNLWTNHNQPDLLISAELGECSMIADWNSCWRYKRAVRLHSLLLHSTYLSHNAEAAFSPVSHSWMAGHCESGRVRHILIYRLTQEAWMKINHQTPQAKAVVWHALSTLLLKVRKKDLGSPFASRSSIAQTKKKRKKRNKKKTFSASNLPE